MVTHSHTSTTPEGWVWLAQNYPSGVKALMQFTGLLDKNGKEIYEGDILKAMRAKYGPGRRGHGNLRGYSEMTLECFFDTERAGFMFRNVSMLWSAGFGLEDSYEVIGNVWENPELLADADI